MKNYILGIAVLSFSFGNQAYSEIVDGAKIVQIYSQSLSSTHKSDAHAIRIDKTINASCSGRLYIDSEDKELFSTVLAYKISGTSFSLMYANNAPGKLILGHLTSTCKLYSIY